MNRIQFGESGCEKTRRYMDDYLSNELLVETNHEMLRHLETCADCARELEMRARLRGRLKSAVQAQAVPPELPALVRERIRQQESRSWLSMNWRYAMTAAVLLIGAAIWVGPSVTPLPDVTDRAAQATYIQKISAAVGPVFQPGLCDHIHCAVFRKYPQYPPSLQEMESRLGDEYQGLLPLVGPAVPEGYKVVLAHQCTYAGRRFVHLTARKGTDVISLVITRKNDGETFRALSPGANASGVPVYQASTESYQVAGFESEHYLAFVVSTLKGKANLQIAEALAPTVRQLLS
jgi:anti-sigma factor (TIGR02949 family)